VCDSSVSASGCGSSCKRLGTGKGVGRQFPPTTGPQTESNMATEPIIVYLPDHLAGSATAIRILESFRDNSLLGAWSSAMLGHFTASMLGAHNRFRDCPIRSSQSCARASRCTKRMPPRIEARVRQEILARFASNDALDAPMYLPWYCPDCRLHNSATVGGRRRRIGLRRCLFIPPILRTAR
jgi:hypothetical protein